MDPSERNPEPMVRFVTPTETRNVPLSSWRPGFLQQPETIMLTPRQAYLYVPYVLRAVNLIAQTISALPAITIDKNGEEAEVLLRDDVPLSTKMPRLLWQASAARQMYGQAYWFKERNRVRLLDVKPMAVESIEPVYDTNNVYGLIGFKRTVDVGVSKDLPLEDVVYHWVPTVAGEYDTEIGPGVAPLSAALPSASLFKAVNDFGRAFFERGAIPAVLLTVEGNPPPEELRRLEAWWKRMSSGVRNAFSTVAVRATVKPQVVGSPVKDLAMPELSASARAQIAVALGVPETMLSDAANYGTAATHMRSFYRETIMPEALQIQATLNEQLYGPLGLTFKFVPERIPALQRDEAEKGTFVMELWAEGAGVITRNEARAMIGQQPVKEFGDEMYDPIDPNNPPITGKPGKVGNPNPRHPPPPAGAGTDRITNPSARSAGDVRRLFEASLAGALAAKMDECGPRMVEEMRGMRALPADGTLLLSPTVIMLLANARSVLIDHQRSVIADRIARLEVDHGIDCDHEYARRATEAWLMGDHTLFFMDRLRKRLTDTCASMIGCDTERAHQRWKASFDSSTYCSPIGVTEVTRACVGGSLIYRAMLHEKGIPCHASWLGEDGDDRACPDCSMNAGKALSDCISHRGGPPAHVGCRCDIELSPMRGA